MPAGRAGIERKISHIFIQIKQHSGLYLGHFYLKKMPAAF